MGKRRIKSQTKLTTAAGINRLFKNFRAEKNSMLKLFFPEMETKNKKTRFMHRHAKKKKHKPDSKQQKQTK